MSNTSILIIDDEPLVGEVLRDFLKDEGYDVHLSADGKEALGVFKEVRPELVITDLNMPGISGFQVAAEVKRMKPSVPVVLLTGWDVDFTTVELQGRGIDALIKKPFAITDILQTIEHLCR